MDLCRICRGESTPSQPLLHPCKCRGSIKYIHQDCLMEWLKHSNKPTVECDICHTPYKFKTIYDPQMPSQIPFKFLWDKLIQMMGNSVVKSVSVSLYILCLIIQIPIFWKFIGRIYTWTIDGKLPTPNSDFMTALLFGELDINKYDSGDIKYQIYRIRKFFDYTYFSGVRYLIVNIIVHLALFVEHEWVVRDEGFAKMLTRKIGTEPRTKLVDMFRNALDGLRNEAAGGNETADDVVNRIEMLARAIDDLQQGGARNDQLIDQLRQNQRNFDEFDETEMMNLIEPMAGLNDQERDSVIRALEGEVQPDVAPPDDNAGNPVDTRHDPFHPANDADTDEDPDYSDGNADSDVDSDADTDDTESDPEQEGLDEPLVPEPVARVPDVPAPPPQRVDRAQALAEDMENFDEDFENIEDNNILELLGLKLNISTPLFLMFVCDVIIAVYLFIMYLIPQTIGTIITSALGMFISVTDTLFVPFYETASEKFHQLKVPEGLYNRMDEKFIEFIIFTVNDLLISPTKVTLTRLLRPNANENPTLIERIISLLLGYTLIGFVIHKLMKNLIKGPKPIMGVARRIYKISFEVVSTLKVFLIFAIEIFFFPVYCGWLLDFCIAPLLLSQFRINNDDGSVKFVLLATSVSEIFTINYVRIALYWCLGTLYMLFFALFIGMIRSKILRPGVLFFIRSPDDPNARLIHDALVKPLMLQLSRIYLSGKVYTGFILIGIGGITWGLRYIVQDAVLPLKLYSFSHLFPMIVCIEQLLQNKQLINTYSEMYWRKGFEISANKLRLSHFILGKPIPQERGYVMYRNLWESIKQTSLPDYSKPVTYKEAVLVFEQNPEINSVFIPNGNYIRVPDNDTVSRKYIKKLFVLVTKDDKLLETPTPVNPDDYETSDDEEITSDNHYAVIYKPPNLKFRCFQLILMLWVFSTILIVSILLIGLLIGRPIIKAFTLLWAMQQYHLAGKGTFMGFVQSQVEVYNWKFGDVGSMSLGVFVELHLLKWYHSVHGAPINEVGFGMNVFGLGQQQQNRGNAAPINPVNGFIKATIASLITSLSFGSVLLWILTVHKYVVDVPLRIGGKEDLKSMIMMDDFVVSWVSVLIHLFISVWTIIPNVLRMFDQNIRNIQFDENLSLMNLARELGLFYNLKRFAAVVGPSLAYIIWRLRKGKFVVSDLYVGVISFVLFVVVDLGFKMRKLMTRVKNEVKNERYVRGRALENVD